MSLKLPVIVQGRRTGTLYKLIAYDVKMAYQYYTAINERTGRNVLLSEADFINIKNSQDGNKSN